jgi:hypothetical protein
LIPISVSDILKILDNIPIWKKLSTMPKRVEDLEQRLAALEKALAAPKPKASRPCPLCAEETKVVRVSNDPMFGALGGKRNHLECTACDYKDTILVTDP